MLDFNFFNRKACTVARALLGKVIRVKYQGQWLSARIIETESYYLHDKSSHASLGYTEKRKALFMPAGTIYMYYSRAGDSMNVSTRGKGNAVLIKSGLIYPYPDPKAKMLTAMQQLNPLKSKTGVRPIEKLCSGQTLLCKSLGLTVKRWDQQQFDKQCFYIEDIGYQPKKIIATTRLGISPDRDSHLPYRYLDETYIKFATKGPSH